MALPSIGIDPAVAHARSRVGVAARLKDATALTDARRSLAEAKLAAYITETVNAAPPLTNEQRARIACLLAPIDSGGGRAA